jgi:hypothetical protein
MSVGKRVEEAIAKMDAADSEGALFQITQSDRFYAARSFSRRRITGFS